MYTRLNIPVSLLYSFKKERKLKAGWSRRW